jgi:hypothetical protein
MYVPRGIAEQVVVFQPGARRHIAHPGAAEVQGGSDPLAWLEIGIRISPDSPIFNPVIEPYFHNFTVCFCFQVEN